MIGTSQEKQCIGCDEIKPLTEFSRKTPTRLQSRCKSCCNVYAQNLRLYGPSPSFRNETVRPAEKCCTRCHLTKPITEFRTRSAYPNLFHSWCKACSYAADKQRDKEHPDAVRERNKRKSANRSYSPSRRSDERLRSFGLTPDEYAQMIHRQCGVCAICRKTETSKGPRGETRSLAIDHDHRTGKVRGLLCFVCNTRLAILEDEAFTSAANAYIAQN